jgi:hypothetical protein
MASRRRPDRQLVHEAKIAGVLARLRNHLRAAQRDGELAVIEARHRAEWPGLWETVDELADLLEHPPPTPGGYHDGVNLPGHGR